MNDFDKMQTSGSNQKQQRQQEAAAGNMEVGAGDGANIFICGSRVTLNDAHIASQPYMIVLKVMWRVRISCIC